MKDHHEHRGTAILAGTVRPLGPPEMSESCFMGTREVLDEPPALLSLWVELRLAESFVSMACRRREKGWDFFCVPPLRHTKMKQDVIAATRIRPEKRTPFSLLLSLFLCCSLSLSPQIYGWVHESLPALLIWLSP